MTIDQDRYYVNETSKQMSECEQCLNGTSVELANRLTYCNSKNVTTLTQ